MEPEVENTRAMHLKTAVLGVYPYVLVQIEPTENGGQRLCVDFNLADYDEVEDMLHEALVEVEMNRWTTN